MLIAGGMLLARSRQNRQEFASWEAVAKLLAVGLIGQWVGNVGFQWSLGVIGIGLAVPLTMGSIIASGAVVGRIWLAEPITGRALVAMAVLLAAIGLLSLGAEQASKAVLVASRNGATLAVLGVAVACVSGVAYTVLGAGIRHFARGQISLPATLFLTSGSGMMTLGIWCLWSLGPAELLATKTDDFTAMVAAGVWNAVAFFSLVRALQLTTLFKVNSLNSSQIAMAAVAGVIWFDEALTAYLIAGVVLTTLGLLIMESRRRNEPREEQ